jgi:hypothetical protein
MGGSALGHTGVRRYKADEFHELVKEVLPKVEKAFNTKVELVRSYKSKESFGDMDILVLDKNSLLDNSLDLINESFHPTDIVSNANVISFDYKNLQIDLIFTEESNWETSRVFFAFNVLGNLMGRIYNK